MVSASPLNSHIHPALRAVCGAKKSVAIYAHHAGALYAHLNSSLRSHRSSRVAAAHSGHARDRARGLEDTHARNNPQVGETCFFACTREAQAPRPGGVEPHTRPQADWPKDPSPPDEGRRRRTEGGRKSRRGGRRVQTRADARPCRLACWHTHLRAQATWGRARWAILPMGQRCEESCRPAAIARRRPGRGAWPPQRYNAWLSSCGGEEAAAAHARRGRRLAGPPLTKELVTGGQDRASRFTSCRDKRGRMESEGKGGRIYFFLFPS